jgi:hypothetical protein
MQDQRADYFRSLEESERPRLYLRGRDPENEETQWLFEVIEDDGRRVVVKQIEVESSGQIHRYWWQQLEDEHGFLADHPLGDAEDVSEASREDFQHFWDT